MSVGLAPRALAIGALLVIAPAAWSARRAASGAEGALQTPAAALPETTFARLVARLSESGGYFDSDNLMSNEASYLHVLGRMRALGVTGGAYLGVGPDQNFSYMAQVRPRIAFIIDIRRDNLLQQLLFKAVFTRTRNRAEYLALLFGRPMPRDWQRWDGSSIEDLVAWVDSTPPSPNAAAAAQETVLSTVKTFDVPLDARDLETISRFHRTFIDAGLDLRYTSHNRPPRAYYPTYRQLLLERDLTGKQGSYLSSEADYRFLKSLQDRNLVIPVVGDLAGEHALVSIGQLIAERGEKISAFYTSNVEQYLMRDGVSFDRFAANLRRLPRDSRSVIIRSYFGGGFYRQHPNTVPGYYSTQLLQTLESFVAEHEAGGYQTYRDVVTKHVLEP
ncbi:MAG: hypothetical protein ABR499_03520 [Gemmatimonadaceae bacterium]